MAGAIGGSGLLSFGENLGLAKYLVQPCLREELTLDSARVRKLLSDTRDKAAGSDIHYVFIGSSLDHLLKKSSLAFPNLAVARTRVIMLANVGHSSIVTSSLPIIKILLKDWLVQKKINSDLVAFSPIIVPHRVE